VVLSIRADDLIYMGIEGTIEIWKRLYSKPNNLTPDNVDILRSWNE